VRAATSTVSAYSRRADLLTFDQRFFAISDAFKIRFAIGPERCHKRM
jgi:hypothetical protein